MRQGPHPKRSRGRSPTNNGNIPGPRKHHLPLRLQTFDSNGPDVRIRGNAYQVYEKYLQLARDMQSAGDRVAGGVGASNLVDAQHPLARALWDARPAERPRARALIEAARRLVAEDLASATELDQWLTEHPLAAP